MIMGLKVLPAVFWLLFVPLMIGRDLAEGYALLFAVTEILAVPMIFAGAPLHLLAIVYVAAILVLFVILRVVPDRGAAVRARIKECPQRTAKWLKEGSWVLWIALFVIAYQMVVMSTMVHIDADDSFYVGQAVTDLATNSVYRFEPYTGNLYPYLPGRYTLSPFPAFLSMSALLCGKIHPAILAHMIMPPMFLAAIYVVMYRFGKRFFPDSAKDRAWFLLICAALFQFSAWTIYNAGNFAMIRIWQGKGFLAGAFLPLLLDQSMTLLFNDGKKSGFAVLAVTVTACCLLSSMGIALAPLCVGSVMLAALAGRKKLVRILGAGLCCLPCAILGALFVLLW